MRRRNGLRAAGVVTIVAVSAGLFGGCGSSGSTSDKSGDVTTTAAAGSQDSGSSATEEPKGDADAGAKLTDAEGKADAAHTVTITGDTMSPDTLSIAKGDIVTFIGGDKGILQVIVPGLDGYTVTNGMWETFKFPKAGTFVVTTNTTSATVKIKVS